jgi:hypothetical protein
MGLSSIRQGNPRLGKVNREVTQLQRKDSLPGATYATSHRLSFPTCLSHPRSIHLHYHPDSPSTAKPPLSWALVTGWTRILQVLWQLQDPLPGVLTSSVPSLTWREFLTGLEACFPQLGFRHSRGNRKTQYEHS